MIRRRHDGGERDGRRDVVEIDALAGLHLLLLVVQGREAAVESPSLGRVARLLRFL